jgi:hypothetical protein
MRVGVIFLVRMRARHALRNGIRRERRKTTVATVMPRAEQRVVVMVMVVTARRVVESKVIITLNLRGCSS